MPNLYVLTNTYVIVWPFYCATLISNFKFIASSVLGNVANFEIQNLFHGRQWDPIVYVFIGK